MLLFVLPRASFLCSNVSVSLFSSRMQTDFMRWTLPHPLLVKSHWHSLVMAAVVSYSPPWWVKLLHRLPHFNLRFEQTSGDFQPDDWTYQQVSWPHRPVLDAAVPQAACRHPPTHCYCFELLFVSLSVSPSTSSCRVWWWWCGCHDQFSPWGQDLLPPVVLLHLLIHVTICVWLFYPCPDLCPRPVSCSLVQHEPGWDLLFSLRCNQSISRVYYATYWAFRLLSAFP